MSATEFVNFLSRFGFKSTNVLPPENFEWLFIPENTRPFLYWLCNAFTQDNILSEDELQQYDKLIAAQSVLHNDALSSALANTPQPPPADDDTPDELLLLGARLRQLTARRDMFFSLKAEHQQRRQQLLSQQQAAERSAAEAQAAAERCGASLAAAADSLRAETGRLYMLYESIMPPDDDDTTEEIQPPRASRPIEGLLLATADVAPYEQADTVFTRAIRVFVEQMREQQPAAIAAESSVAGGQHSASDTPAPAASASSRADAIVQQILFGGEGSLGMRSDLAGRTPTGTVAGDVPGGDPVLARQSEELARLQALYPITQVQLLEASARAAAWESIGTSVALDTATTAAAAEAANDRDTYASGAAPAARSALTPGEWRLLEGLFEAPEGHAFASARVEAALEPDLWLPDDDGTSGNGDGNGGAEGGQHSSHPTAAAALPASSSAEGASCADRLRAAAEALTEIFGRSLHSMLERLARVQGAEIVQHSYRARHQHHLRWRHFHRKLAELLAGQQARHALLCASLRTEQCLHAEIGRLLGAVGTELLTVLRRAEQHAQSALPYQPDMAFGLNSLEDVGVQVGDERPRSASAATSSRGGRLTIASDDRTARRLHALLSGETSMVSGNQEDGVVPRTMEASAALGASFLLSHAALLELCHRAARDAASNQIASPSSDPREDAATPSQQPNLASMQMAHRARTELLRQVGSLVDIVGRLLLGASAGSPIAGRPLPAPAPVLQAAHRLEAASNRLASELARLITESRRLVPQVADGQQPAGRAVVGDSGLAALDRDLFVHFFVSSQTLVALVEELEQRARAQAIRAL